MISLTTMIPNPKSLQKNTQRRSTLFNVQEKRELHQELSELRSEQLRSEAGDAHLSEQLHVKDDTCSAEDGWMIL